MKDKLLRHAPVIVLLTLGAIFLFTFYGTVLLSPNSYFFGGTGDSLKNYFTYAYYARYGDSFIEFSGMNYPYGEHFLYTDCTPLLALIIKGMGLIFPGVNNYAIGFFNLVLLLAIPVAMYVSFLLFKELGVFSWYAVIFAFMLVIAAPQAHRISCHYGLSFTVAIPLAWLLALKMFKGAKYAWLWLIISTVGWFFMHAYLGMVVAFFIGALLGVQYFKKNWRTQARTYWTKALIVAILPTLLFYSFIKITDTHVDRTDNPYGFFHYYAEPDDLFFPTNPPMAPIYAEHLKFIRQEHEARGFLGHTNTLLLLFISVSLLAAIGWKKPRNLLKQFFGKTELNQALIAGTIVLFFAMGLPFVLHKPLLDYVPILKQFRALGRFVWPFVFVWSVICAWALAQWMTKWRSQKKTPLVIGVSSLVILISFADFIPIHYNLGNELQQSSNHFVRESTPETIQALLPELNEEQDQAILSLPFSYTGSEYYSRPHHHEATGNSILLSYHSGIPLVGAQLIRTSISESKHIIQLFSPNIFEKPIAKEILPEKTVVLAVTGDVLTKYEQALIKRARLVKEAGNMKLYRISKEQLFEDEATAIQKRFKQIKEELYETQGFLVQDSIALVYHHGFEDTPCDTAHQGSGSFSGRKKGRNEVLRIPEGTFSSGKGRYLVSCWMFNNEKDALNLGFKAHFEEITPDGQVLDHTCSPSESEVVIGDWSLCEIAFDLVNSQSSFLLWTEGKKQSKANLHVDDVLIRPANVDVYRETPGGSLFVNNLEIPLN